MSIEIKRSVKPVDYNVAIQLLEKRLENVINKSEKELIWFLEHNEIYTAGTSSNTNDIIDKTIKVIKTSRGGKITHHSHGQLICYFAIDLSKRNKDIRKFIISIENSIIETFSEFNIYTKSDRKNIGIWVNHDNESKKIGAIGIRVKKRVTKHGLAVNISNNLDLFSQFTPCGIKGCEVSSLEAITGNTISLGEISHKFISFSQNPSSLPAATYARSNAAEPNLLIPAVDFKI